MSTNHTPNFNLCQWEADDKVLRSDFNADNQKIDAALAGLQQSMGNCRIVTGSYVGTGKYGPSNRNTLTFDGKPLLVIIQNAFSITAVSPAPTAPVLQDGGNQYYSVSLTWTDNNVSWYNESLPERQLNVSGRTYYYAALLES